MKLNRTRFIAKAQAEYGKHAGEAITVEIIGGEIFAFGSELATLRLFKTYNRVVMEHAFSRRRDAHFVVLPLTCELTEAA